MRNRVEVGAEHQPLLPTPGDPRDQVSGARPGRIGGAVLADLDAETAKFRKHVVGDGALLAGRAGNLAEPHEAVEHALVAVHQAAGYASRGGVRRR